MKLFNYLYNKFNGSDKFIKEDFDEVTDVDGKAKKQFVRCQGSFLNELFEIKKAKKPSNYVTCVDELFEDKDFSKEEFDNFKVSVMLKKFMSKNSARNEIICSRLANLFNITTQYVAPDIFRNNICIIVDFLKGEEKLENYKEFTGTKPEAYTRLSIKSWIQNLVDAIYRKYDFKDLPSITKSVRPMVKELIKQYIFKKYIVHDYDFGYTNLGIVSTPNYKEMSIAPMYDCAGSFLIGKRTQKFYGLDEDMAYLAKTWPDILNEIIKDFELNSEKKKSVNNIIYEFEMNNELADFLIKTVNGSAINVLMTARKELSKCNEVSHETIDD